MKLKNIYLKDFENNKDFFYKQIPRAQNSDLHYSDDIFIYYLESLKEHPQSFISVAEHNGEVVGCALFKYYKELDKFFIVNVNTRKDFQHTKYKVATSVVASGLEHFFDKTGKTDIFCGYIHLILQQSRHMKKIVLRGEKLIFQSCPIMSTLKATPYIDALSKIF